MANRIGELQNRCLRKVAHRDRASALRAIRGDHQLQPYRCPLCDQWHVGHRRRGRG